MDDKKKQIIDIISSILEKKLRDDDFLKPLEELNFDSIIFIRIIVQCETQFDFEFEDSMLLMSKYSDLNEFISYILTQKGDKK